MSHDHRFIFLKTRKTGGTSLEIALSDVCGPDDVMTPLISADERLRRSRGKQAQNFGSPPLLKTVSNHARARGARSAVGTEVWDSYFKFSVERNPWDQVVSLYYWACRTLDDAPTFDEYVRSPRIAAFAKANGNGYRIDDSIVVDRVCRYEHLADDLQDVWTLLDLPGAPDLPHTKGGVRPGGVPYQELYDDETRAIVAGHFADAIRDFDYEF